MYIYISISNLISNLTSTNQYLLDQTSNIISIYQNSLTIYISTIILKKRIYQILRYLPSGKHTKNYGKIHPTING